MKQQGAQVRRDCAGVVDLPSDPDGNLAAISGVLDRVSNQVRDHLEQAVGIPFAGEIPSAVEVDGSA
jgi:hypothetical protein